MRRLLILVVLAAALAAVLAVPAGAARNHSVALRGFTFHPAKLTIVHNTRITFRWYNFHNLRVANGPQRFSISARDHGTVVRKFTRRGFYRLVCDIHPGMTLALRVK